VRKGNNGATGWSPLGISRWGVRVCVVAVEPFDDRGNRRHQRRSTRRGPVDPVVRFDRAVLDRELRRAMSSSTRSSAPGSEDPRGRLGRRDRRAERVAVARLAVDILGVNGATGAVEGDAVEPTSP
jgi:hypothetical protein